MNILFWRSKYRKKVEKRDLQVKNFFVVHSLFCFLANHWSKWTFLFSLDPLCKLNLTFEERNMYKKKAKKRRDLARLIRNKQNVDSNKDGQRSCSTLNQNWIRYTQGIPLSFKHFIIKNGDGIFELLELIHSRGRHPFAPYIDDIQGWDPFAMYSKRLFPGVDPPLLCKLIHSRGGHPFTPYVDDIQGWDPFAI